MHYFLVNIFNSLLILVNDIFDKINPKLILTNCISFQCIIVNVNFKFQRQVKMKYKMSSSITISQWYHTYVMLYVANGVGALQILIIFISS